MKLQSGNKYLTECGEVTSKMQVSSRSNKYPFYDTGSGWVYDEGGTCGNGKQKDNIVSVYYEPAPTQKPCVTNTITIGIERYNQLVSIEKSFKDILTSAKKYL